MNGINMDLSKILTAKDGRELLEYSKDAYDLVQAEKNRPIPLVITLTGNEIDEVELDETLQIDPKKIYEKRVSTFFKKNISGKPIEHPFLGLIGINNNESWGKIKSNIRQKSLRTQLIPAIPAILEKGKCTLIETARSGQAKDYVYFAYLHANVNVGGTIVHAALSIVFRADLNRFVYNITDKPEFLQQHRDEQKYEGVRTIAGFDSMNGADSFNLEILSSSTNSAFTEGRQNKIKTAKGTRLDTALAVIESSDLIASHDHLGNANPDYPQELQPRDRSRETSQAQIQKIAKDLDPESLGRSSRADSGAPIVGSDKVVESGNGRTIAIQLAYATGKAQEYKDWLIENADYFGLSAEKIKSMRQPVLVRVRKTEVDRAQFALEANQDDKLSYSATERAKSDAKRINAGLLELFNPDDSGNLMAASNSKFISAFLDSLGSDEAAQYVTTDGKPTQALVMRIKSAVFSKAYNDDRLLEMVADQTKPDLQNVLNALSIAAPKFIEAQAISGAVKGQVEDVSSSIVDSIEKSLDKRIVNAILDATNMIEKAKLNQQAISEYVSQLGLFGDIAEGVPELAVFIAENARSAKKLSIAFKSMAEFAEKTAADSQNFGLFGEPEPVSIKDAVDYANNALVVAYGDGKSQISMFDSTEAEKQNLKQSVEAAAEVSAISVDNELTHTSEKDLIDGNYLKGKFRIDEHEIVIENPAGSIRSGQDKAGNEWQTQMHHHYGYINGTEGADGDELDVFIKADAKSLEGDVFVIHQIDPDTLEFDEHKVVLGADSQNDAKSIYLSNYELGWRGLGDITSMSFKKFKEKLAHEWNATINLFDDATGVDFATTQKYTPERRQIDLEPFKSLVDVDAKAHPLNALKLAMDCIMYRGTAPAFEQVNPLVNYTTKKGKTLQGIVIPFEKVKRKLEAAELDPYTFMYERSGWFIRLKHLSGIDNAVLTPEQILLKEKLNASDSSANPSNINQVRDGQGNTTNLANESAPAGDLARTTGTENGAGADTGNSATGLSESDATSIGGKRNSGDAGKRKRGIVGSDFTTNDSRGSSADGQQGSSTRSQRDRNFIQSAQTAGAELTGKALLQQKAEGTETVWGEAESVHTALPYLLTEQCEDVIKAEKRLVLENKNGILFTNGTGTGKTFTGLGTVKRFANAGKNNILIVSMNDKIVRDFVKSAKALSLNIHQLTGIDDNGGQEHSMIATTYANFAQNETLADKDWDLIIVDESHNLMQSEDGKETAALRKLRALTGHHRGFYDWFDNKHRAERPPKIMIDAPVFDENNKPVMNADGTQKTQKVEGENFAPGPEFDAWFNKQAKQKELWKKRWNDQPTGRTKVVFLSATPWPYVKTIEWAEGFLFDYVEPAKLWKEEKQGSAYNSGGDRENFFMRNFGFTMRYNKMTRPDGKVDSGVNEREFNNKLKAEGAVSGRELEVAFDYDRRFILIESEAGKEIDRGLEILSSTKDENGNSAYSDLSRAVSSRFNYLSRERLLEAIKADAAIDQIKKSIALGRKVVVFHDYNEGGGFSPFFFASNGFSAYSENRQSVSAMEAQYSRFSAEHKDLTQLNLSFPSPIDTLTSAFPNALLFNGRVSKGQRAKNADLFNADGNGYNLIIVQSDAGSTGISFHDTTGKHQRVIFNLGLPKRPAKLRQTEGRIYRVGQASNAIHRYLTTGTNWETSAFAHTIAQRAETVDNLAKGDDAVVSIRDAIITAYQNAEYFEPSTQDGIGGKAYDEENARLARMTAFDKAKTFYYNKGKDRNSRKNKIGKDWYATPEPLGLKMMHWAGVHKGDDVLEPSAGDGAIGRWIPSDANGTMIEPSTELASRAQLANTSAKVEQGTFENHSTLIKYDAVVMNPPFGHAGAQALEHVKKACKHVREGGRVVALIPQSSNLERGLEQWLSSHDGREFYTAARIVLPASTFANANTSVNTFVLILERHASVDTAPNMRTLDFSHIANNEDLFEAIRDVNITPRKLREDEALMEYGLAISPFRSNYILTGIGVSNPEIREALLKNRFVYESSKDPNTLECYSRNIKSILQTLDENGANKLLPHTHNAYDGWQHDGTFERIQLKQIKVDLTKYVRREKQANMKHAVVVQEIGQHYKLISGYERFRLAKEKSETFVPAIIVPEQYVIGKTSLAKAYRETAIPLDTEVFAHHLFDVLEEEAEALLT
jgi:dGTP triphosphohydrolase